MSYFEDNYNSVRYPISTESTAGLRRAQIGAIHAIASHFTRYKEPTSVDPAIVVMPTGSGKTAVLILSAFVLRAKKVLVVTPSRLVREQVAKRFQNLDLLKSIGALVGDVGENKVNLLTSKQTSRVDWENLREYDVTVSTPNCISPEYRDIVKPSSDLFDLLLIDEGHHVPAKTWRAILAAFPNARKVLFTATPFRLDKREIPGTIVYEFSIREAYDDKIFGDIEFVPVEIGSRYSADIAIAEETEKIYLEDTNNGLDHCILVRTDTKKHARELLKVYEDKTKLDLRLIYSSHSLRYVNQTLKLLQQKKLAGIICVDMLGEGFDFPNMKIAAIHTPHKSLPVTLQFIGRFARINTERIGKAKFIAIPESIRIDAKQLYRENQKWQEIIPDLYQSRIDEEMRIRHDMSTFESTIYAKAYSGAGNKKDIVEDLSLFSLTPSHHVKVYEMPDGVDLEFAAEDIELNNLKVIRSEKSDELSALVMLTEEIKVPKWTTSQAYARVEYDLIVVYFNVATGLLFINSSRRSDAIYEKIAAQFAVGGYIPLPLNKIDKVLLSLKSPEFFNIGMRNRLQNSQTESYRIIAGPNVERAINRSDGRLYHRGHVYGRGGTIGNRATLGYSSSSKVWSSRSSYVPELIYWCRSLAQRITSNESVVTGTGIDVLSAGQSISILPDDIWRVDWEKSVYLKLPKVKYQADDGSIIHCQLLDLDLTIDRGNTNKSNIRIRIEGKDLNWAVDYSPTSRPFFKEVNSNQKEISILKGQYNETDMIDYLNSHPVHFYTVDQSLITGSLIFRPLDKYSPYDSSMIQTIEWEKEGVDIKKEFGKPKASGKRSIHQYLEDYLRMSIDDVVFYDHGTGEIADFVTFKLTKDKLLISLYHAKASSGSKPGARVADVYEVCAQAVKSLIWLSINKLTDHIHYRSIRKQYFIKGNFEQLEKIIDDRGLIPTMYKIFIVQPGIKSSLLETEAKIAEVLASSNDYIDRAGCEGFYAMASK